MPQKIYLLDADEQKQLDEDKKSNLPLQDQKYNFPSPSEFVKNVGVGVAKGALQTVEGGGAMLRRWFPSLNNLPEYQADINIDPTNWQQSVGSGIEHGLEYMGGSASVPFRMIPQGLMAAGLAGAHTGGDPNAMLGSGIVGAAMPQISGILSRSMPGRIVKAIGQWANSKVPAPPPGAAPAMTGRMLGGLPPASAEYSWGSTPSYSWQGSGQLPEYIPPVPGQIEGGQGGSPSLPPGPTPPRQLGPAPGMMVPAGSESGITPDPRLPSSYASIPGPTAPPATAGGMQLGQEGGIPARGEQTVTGTHLPLGRVPKGQPGAGTFRPLTSREMNQFVAQKGTVGKTAVEPPSPPRKVSPKKK